MRRDEGKTRVEIEKEKEKEKEETSLLPSLLNHPPISSTGGGEGRE